MMGYRAPGSRHCRGRAPSEARGIRPSRYRPDGPGTPRGGRLDRGRPAGPQDGPAGPPPVAAVSERSHRHMGSGTCTRLARTILPSIDTLKPNCRRAWSTSRRHILCTHGTRARTRAGSQISVAQGISGTEGSPKRVYASGAVAPGEHSALARIPGAALVDARPGLKVEAFEGRRAGHAHTGSVSGRSVAWRALGSW